MIQWLKVENVAVIEAAEVHFGPGLNVVTGETGAGKSVLIGALGLVLGSRGGTHLVRTGATCGRVEASFAVGGQLAVQRALRELELPACETLEVRRVLPASGSGRAHLNGKPVPIRVLQKLAPLLLDAAAQHDQRRLLDPDHHRELLDGFASTRGDVERVAAAHAELLTRRRELDRLRRDADRVTEREEYLRFQLDELAKLSLTPGEADRIELDLVRLRHATELREGARAAEAELYSAENSVLDRLARAESQLRALARFDARHAARAEALTSLSYQLEDVSRELAQAADQAQAEPGRLEELESRRAEIRRLTRKHRCAPDDLIEREAHLRSELDVLGNLEVRLEEAEAAVARARVRALEHADVLTRARVHAAGRLDAAVDTQLQALGMDQARFVTRVSSLTEGVALDRERFLAAHGADRVDFLWSANPGEDPRPLAKVASGGEMSRVLLALKVAQGMGQRSFLFDEIDTGIGGEAAERVGATLRALAEGGQLICISHQPQIAALADHHFQVSKLVTGGRTRSRVQGLDPDGRVDEVARMVGGTAVTAASRAYAQQLLQAYARVA